MTRGKSLKLKKKTKNEKTAITKTRKKLKTKKKCRPMKIQNSRSVKSIQKSAKCLQKSKNLIV